jgi:NAD(P)-dependent dehydrogenase (short-subunit alcohol dehydrogenase family)
MRLRDSVCLVTGAGRGIGRAIALRFASEGARVAIAGPNADSINEVARRARERSGKAMAIRADVSDEASVKQMIASALAEFGRIDVLVNNAGIIGPTAPATSISRQDWDEVIAVNLTGAFLCAKHALPSMIERQSGRIINITSIAGKLAYALRSPYAVSKWGMIGLTRTLAEEVGRYNITVNAIAPGPVRGPRMEEVISRRAAELQLSIEEVERQYVEQTALKRMVEEEDIAAMAVFLASDEGRNITGEVFVVSGGFRL